MDQAAYASDPTTWREVSPCVRAVSSSCCVPPSENAAMPRAFLRRMLPGKVYQEGHKNRLATVLWYLNSPGGGGGETQFPLSRGGARPPLDGGCRGLKVLPVKAALTLTLSLTLTPKPNPHA